MLSTHRPRDLWLRYAKTWSVAPHRSPIQLAADLLVVSPRDDRQNVDTGELAVELAEACLKLTRPVGIQPDDVCPRSIDIADGARELSLVDAGIVVDGEVAAGRATEPSRSTSVPARFTDTPMSVVPSRQHASRSPWRSTALSASPPSKLSLEAGDRLSIPRQPRVIVTRPS